jgi:bacillithiol system protein YtxJ
MNWIELKDEETLEQIKAISNEHPVLLFKHSTRCSISAAALDRLERNWKDAEMTKVAPYYLDLLSYRPISTKIQTIFNVEHESPQVLIIKNGRCVYHASHIDINYKELVPYAN